jgi:DNA-binding transcriptional MerR regulator
MDNDEPLLSIGKLARRTGLPVRTIRFWSDAGVLPPAARAEGGRRLYDAACADQAELVATLRELGLGLADVRRVLAGQASIAEVAACSARPMTRRRRDVLSTARAAPSISTRGKRVTGSSMTLPQARRSSRNLTRCAATASGYSTAAPRSAAPGSQPENPQSRARRQTA